jgi:serine/threonine protein kinase
VHALLHWDADELDDDGKPISAIVPGDRLPDDARAWSRLGVGHRCETWLAWSPRLCAPVVTKFPRPHQIDHPRARRSLGREVAALHDNPHPALPHLYVDGTAEPVPFLEFEYIDGPALDDEIDEHGGFAPVEVALVSVQLLAALRTVHARGLAHIDIKPENVVLRGGRPVLLDFGSARPLGAQQPKGAMIGSPGYASPDLEAGDPLSPAMDMYGVGVTMYQALAGAPAFDPETPAAERPAPAALDASPTAELVLGLLDPDPARRPLLDDALGALAGICAEGGVPPWPDWVRV